MRIAYFDTFSGISGDMVLGACVNAGISLEHLRTELQRLDLVGYGLNERTIVRSMIAATKIDVNIDDGKDRQPAVARSHHHTHDHHAYNEIVRLVAASSLPDGVKDRAGRIFHSIAEAEARIHDVAVEEVHFHEVGAIDSIVDIVGTAICLESLGIERIFSGPVRTGSGGFVHTQHGVMPVPTPATLEILKNYPLVFTDIPHELATPTGAAILAALSDGLLPAGVELRIETIGYGAGGRDIPDVPNLLRLIVATIEEDYDRDELVAIETNIDDMNPELYPYLIDRLLAAGAHDAFLVPVIMKKGRPGILLSILTARSLMEEILRLLYRETTTIGVRVQSVHRRKLPREERILQTSFGPVTMKVVTIEGKEYLRPEFEECRRIAEKYSVPLHEVYRRLDHETSP